MKTRVSLRLRFASLIIIMLAIVFGLITVVRVHQNRKVLQAELTERTQSFAKLTESEIVDGYERYGNSPQLNNYLAQLRQLDSTINGITLLDSQQRVIYSLGQAPTSNTIKAASYYSSDGDLYSLVLPQTSDSVAAIAYQVSDAGVSAAIHKQIQSIVLFSVLGTLASAAVVLAAMDLAVIRPIKRLTRRAADISGGRYNGPPIKIRRHDEIGVLANSMNSMQASLKKTTDQMNQLDEAKSEFMMIASHTLRTPITVIKGSLEVIKTEPIGDSSKHMLEVAEVATQRLSSFAEDLLVVSTLEVGQQTIKLTPLAVDNTFDVILTYAKAQAEQKEIDFQADIQANTNASIAANRPYLGNAVWNIVDNALKFTAKHGLVRFSLKVDNNSLLISISDNGIGIHEAEINKVFDKLHRGTSTEQYDYDGTGIGLYVSKQIIDAHHGSISVDSALGKGSAFTIKLPLLETTKKAD